jgi:hypothetical protein
MKAFGPSAELLAARYLTGAQPLLVISWGALVTSRFGMAMCASLV